MPIPMSVDLGKEEMDRSKMWRKHKGMKPVSNLKDISLDVENKHLIIFYHFWNIIIIEDDIKEEYSQQER